MTELKHRLPTAEETANGMHFWKVLQKNKNIKTKIYFDSAGAVDMLTGTFSVFKGNTFQRNLYERPSNLVYALAYRKWLGEIYMLPPHTEELIDTLYFNERVFPQNTTKENQLQNQELWYKLLKTRDLSGLQQLIRNGKKIDKEIINEIQRHPYHIFIGLYLTAGKNYWKYRYKHLVKDKQILCFSHDTDYNHGDVTNTILFKKVNSLLNEKRARTANNYVDAISLCLLDEKLRNAQSTSEQAIVPLFFSNQEHILQTVNELSELKDEQTGHRYFMYFDKESGGYFPIVRKASLFIIEGFVNAMRNNNNDEAIIELEKVLNNILEGVKELETEKRNVNDFHLMNEQYLEPNIHERVMLEFFDRWWKDNGADEIIKTLELQAAEELTDLDKSINDQIEEDRERLGRKIKGFGSRIQLIRNAWHAFIGLDKSIAKNYIRPHATADAYNEFGPRFNFSESVCTKIQNWIDRAINAVAGHDLEELKTVEAETVSDLVDGLFEQPTDSTYTSDNQLDQLAASIGFFYFFEKYEVVKDACEIIRLRYADTKDKYPSPSIALIHAASGFRGKRSPVDMDLAEKKALRIIDCVKGKAENNYKIWIALSYAYNILWEHRIKGYKFRELQQPKNYCELLKSKGVEYINEAIRYSQKAVYFLEELFKNESDSGKLIRRKQKYYYALNNYLFFNLFYTTPEVFIKLESYKDKLEEVSYNSDYYQEDKFSDTLARYYFRSAILANNKQYFEIDLLDAEDYNERSRQHKPKELYKSLEKMLRRAKIDGYRKAVEKKRSHDSYLKNNDLNLV